MNKNLSQMLSIVRWLEPDPAHHQRAFRYLAHFRNKMGLSEKAFYEADMRGDTEWFFNLALEYPKFELDYQDILLKEGL